ncbi:MAG: choice-of-anchor Q domain-containing protein [Acidobacteriota bacterium]
MHSESKPLAVALALVAAGFLLAAPSWAATFFVDSLLDSGPETLRQAILDANGSPGADTILFGAGLSGTILLSEPLPPVLESVSIIGPAALVLVINAQENGRHLEFRGPDESVYSMQGLSLRGGLTSNGGGGAIQIVRGELTLESMAFFENSTAGAVGGAVFGSPDTRIFVRRSTFTLNSAASGGAIGGAQVFIDQSTLYDNTAQRGGGVYATEVLRIQESTLSGNSASSDGGGAYSLGELIMYQSTVTDNVGGNSGGLFQLGPVTAVGGVIIAGNRLTGGAESNCSGDLGIEGSLNLSGDASCGFTGAGDLENTDPMLAPLAAAGGQTLTHVPLLGSPVINASAPGLCIDVDQRDFPRPQDGLGTGTPTCDIGAVEFTPGIDDVIFGDGFESGTIGRWSEVIGLIE